MERRKLKRIGMNGSRSKMKNANIYLQLITRRNANSSWITRNTVHLWTECYRKQKLMLTFTKNSYWTVEIIFTWIDKIVASGAIKIHFLFKKNQCIYKNSLHGAYYVLESLAYAFFKTKLATLLLSVVYHIGKFIIQWNQWFELWWNLHHFTSNQTS